MVVFGAATVPVWVSFSDCFQFRGRNFFSNAWRKACQASIGGDSSASMCLTVAFHQRRRRHPGETRKKAAMTGRGTATSANHTMGQALWLCAKRGWKGWGQEIRGEIVATCCPTVCDQTTCRL